MHTYLIVLDGLSFLIFRQLRKNPRKFKKMIPYQERICLPKESVRNLPFCACCPGRLWWARLSSPWPEAASQWGDPRVVMVVGGGLWDYP